MADRELKWWHVRWELAGRTLSRFSILSGKVLGSLCLVAAIGYGIFYLLSPWLLARRMSAFDSQLNLLPADLPAVAEASLSTTVIHCYGFGVQLPDEEVARTYKGNLETMVAFRNGGMLVVRNPLRYSSSFEDAISDRQMVTLIGPEVLRSKYSLLRAAMFVTPRQVRWWKFHTVENQRADYLLLKKFSFLTGSAFSHTAAMIPIYAISIGRFHGFQIGDPNASPYEAHVDVFDESDRYFTFDIIGQRQHGQVLTQAEINAIVASIKAE